MTPFFLLIGLATFCAIPLFAMLALSEAKDDDQVFWDKWWNWNNSAMYALWRYPDLFTEKGRMYRKLHFAAGGLFLFVILGPFFIP
ncbi:MAG: hypothetical protein O3C43_03355 [Verrucomicrobia bacterium]|nr:hypothetical protein [Verrucomicrobiota bacterium]MDA1065521.1 hypothetical protein [Verrucomicrobiota bacterium]